MMEQLPVPVQTRSVTRSIDAGLVPGLIADAGDQVAWRYIDFFTPPTSATRTHDAPMRARAVSSSPSAQSAA